MLIVNGRGKKTLFPEFHTRGKTCRRFQNTRKNNRANKSLSEKAAYPKVAYRNKKYHKSKKKNSKNGSNTGKHYLWRPIINFSEFEEIYF